MIEIQLLALLCVVMTAVLFDLQRGRIPNSVIVTGVLLGGAYHLFTGGILGTMIFLGGVFLPVVLFGAFYYFRMIGAGDVKLLCVVGGFLGPSACFSCIVAAVLSGGVISMVLMAHRHNFNQRLVCFSDYVSRCSKDGRWNSYLEGTQEDAKLCFSVPVLLGILYYMGGI